MASAQLLRAAEAGDAEPVDKYMFLGRDKPDHSNAEGDGALHVAASAGRLEVCQFLLAKGANVDLRNKHGVTALHVAKTAAVVATLLEYGASLKKKDKRTGHTVSQHWKMKKMGEGGFSRRQQRRNSVTEDRRRQKEADAAYAAAKASSEVIGTSAAEPVAEVPADSAATILEAIAGKPTGR